MHRQAALALLVLLLAPPATAAPPSTADEIEQCMRDNLPRENSTQTVALRSFNRVGDVAKSNATIFWQQGDDGLSKLLLRFNEPLDTRDAGVLMLEKTGRSPDTFLYLPSTKMVRRVSSRAASSSLFGTDFSYEDFSRLVGMAADSARLRGEDSEVSGRPVYVLSATPAPDAHSAYERVVSFVDHESCVPLRVESYEVGGALRKRLSADASKLTREASSWVPRRLTMEDLRDETRTEVVVEEIDTETKIHRKIFSARELEAGGH
jgi:outer membrane lipoprotein-sorting protein